MRERSYNDIAAMDCWLYRRYKTGKRKPNEFMRAMIRRLGQVRFKWIDEVYKRAPLGEADPNIEIEKSRKYPWALYYTFHYV